MIETNFPMTQAIRVLKDHGVPFTIHAYKYEEHGGTPIAARALGVDEHLVVKTLVFETETHEPLVVVMHGDKDVSTKNLARTLGVKAVHPCSPEAASKHTGYIVGGISPFGTRKRLKVFLERSVTDMPKIYINAGKRGLLAEIAPADLMKILSPALIEVGI
ncbi:MAG: Cys-tRNA(Pro) deacylase [Candidatus Aminicenantes bacterium]|nr:Cys-tRNA(Pro) deacylase [Candidatus Aminicenantes bacterium]